MGVTVWNRISTTVVVVIVVVILMATTILAVVILAIVKWIQSAFTFCHCSGDETLKKSHVLVLSDQRGSWNQ